MGMKSTKGIFDELELDIGGVLLENGLVDDLLHYQDLSNRKLFLASDITQDIVSDIVRNILQYNTEDKEIPTEERNPIFLYLVSRGGEVDAGFQLIDTILHSKTPVYTINTGYQYSMGFLIGLAGHKRFGTPNAKYLMHDGTYAVCNSSTKIRDHMKFQEREDERLKQYILEHSNITADEYDANLRVEWYMFADEAKQKGFVDYIIGQDCDIDMVI